ncbi:hypothetical protein PCE1_000291 [Barthelona sp. PCE]
MDEWEERRALQHDLARRAIIADEEGAEYRYIGGLDISFSPKYPTKGFAALSIYDMTIKKIIYVVSLEVDEDLEYRSGFLAFREVDPYYRLVEKLREERPDLEPDLLLVDGNGVYHMLHCGSATHLGVQYDLKTTGVAKNMLLYDNFDVELRNKAKTLVTDENPVYDMIESDGFFAGCIVKATRASSKPIYVSGGHRISHEKSCEIVLACCNHRVPEPIRSSDLKTREMISSWEIDHDYES